MSRLIVQTRQVLLLLIASLLSLLLFSCAGNRVIVSGIVPEGTVPRQTNLSIEFSHDIVPPSQVDVLLDSAAVEFDPPIPGRFRWIDTRTLQFLPTESLLPSTRYVLTIDPAIVEDPDIRLAGQRTFQFETPRLRVLSVNPLIKPLKEDPSLVSVNIGLRFSEIVESSEIEKHVKVFRIKPFREEVSYNLLKKLPSQGFTIQTETIPSDPEKESELEIVISKALLCEGGDLELGEEVKRKISFGSPKELKIRRVGTTQRGNRNFITIDLSSHVDPVVAKEFIELEPAAEFSITSQYSSRLLLDGGFKSGDKVKVIINEGFAGRDQSKLRKTFTQSVSFPDLKPSIKFTSPGKYLSRKGLKNVELEIINLDKIHIEVEKIYLNNLVHYLHGSSSRHGYDHYGTRYRSSGSYFGKRIHEEDIEVSAGRNEITPATVNFDQFLSEHRAGLFRLTIRSAEKYWRKDSRTVMVTNIGLLAKRTEEELHVWALSTMELDPLAGVKVKLISNTNQVISQSTTDSEGRAVFSNLKQTLEEFDLFLVTAEQGSDFSFLLFSETGIDRADFDVDGRPVIKEGFESYLYTDRGIYRPGETVHLAGVIRLHGGQVPSDFPLELTVVGPDGRTMTTQRGRTGIQGMVEFAIPVTGYARTGQYRADLSLPGDNPQGTTTFQVEEFLPDRIKVEVNTDRESYRTGDTIKVDITGTMLFGPPAAGRESEARIRIEPTPFLSDNWKSYQFGNPSVAFGMFEHEMGTGSLDSEGKTTFEYEIPAELHPPAALRVIIEATVLETGGRAVTGLTTADIHPYPLYIGLKRNTEGYAKVGEEVRFSFVTLSPEGKPEPASELVASLIKYRWQTILQVDNDGRYRYVSEKTEEPVKQVNLTADKATGEFTFSPSAYGYYIVRLEHPVSGAAATLDFHVSGWGYSPWSMEQPERIELELDREKYLPGQNAKALVKAPFPGMLLITVEREKVMYSRLVRMTGNTAEISLPVRQEFAPNAYVTATLVCSAKEGNIHSPMRAYGTVPVYLDMSSHRLDLTVSAPNEMRPNKPLEVDIRLRSAGSTAAVTVAAIDEGILQLTGFAAPDAHGLFYGKKRLDVDTYDIFSLLMPEAKPAEIHSSSAGDRAPRRLSHISRLSTARLKPVALWSGILPVTGGRAHVRLDVPQFNGQLRIMTLAVEGMNFDVAESFVTVRDPIVLMPTVPRFVAGGDVFRIPVSVYNGTGSSTEIEVTLAVEGPLIPSGETSRKLKLEADKEGIVGFELKAEEAYRLATLTFSAQGGGHKVLSTINLPVRPPVPPVSLTGSGSFIAGKDAVIKMPDKFIEGTANYSLHLISLPAMEFASGLQYLLRYPHGCLEQTVSRAFPLLYFDDLARVVEPDRFDENAPEYYVNEAIDRVVSMQDNTGAFLFWHRGNRVNNWAAIYSLHFLAEAELAGYVIPKSVLDKGRKYLRSIAHGKSHILPEKSDYKKRYGDRWKEKRREETYRYRAYAAYVLALMGKAEKGAMNYLMEEKRYMLTPDALALLSGAYALAGDMLSAKSLLPLLPDKAFSPYQTERDDGYSFHSPVRADAIILYVLSEIAPEHPLVPILMKSLGKRAETGRWHTTQENAWALLALGKNLAKQTGADYEGKIRIGKQETAEFAVDPFTFSDSALGGKTIHLSIQGEGRCYYYYEARGIPPKHKILDDHNGLEVRRILYNSGGGSISLDKIPQGELIIAQIKIKTHDRSIENVIIDDLLPSGFEIENPRLESRKRMSWLPDNSIKPEAMDIRDDRLLIYLNLRADTEVTFNYAVRAVTAGTFYLPPVNAECMYDPTFFSVSSSGFVKIGVP